MTAHFQRGYVLYQQGRHRDAIALLHRHIGRHQHDTGTRPALLGPGAHFRRAHGQGIGPDRGCRGGAMIQEGVD